MRRHPADRFEQEATATAERVTKSDVGQRQEDDQREEPPPTVQGAYTIATVQRQVPASVGATPVGATSVATTALMGEPGEQAQSRQADPVGAVLSVATLRNIRGTATQTTFLAAAYAKLGRKTVDMLQSSLAEYSRNYANAYGTHARSVREAWHEALHQQEWTNIFLGVGLGIGIGLAPEVFIAEEVLEGASWGMKALMKLGKETVKEGLKMGIEATGVTKVEGTELEPGGVSPDARNSQLRERLNKLYRDVLKIQLCTTPCLLYSATSSTLSASSDCKKLASKLT